MYGSVQQIEWGPVWQASTIPNTHREFPSCRSSRAHADSSRFRRIPNSTISLERLKRESITWAT